MSAIGPASALPTPKGPRCTCGKPIQWEKGWACKGRLFCSLDCAALGGVPEAKRVPKKGPCPRCKVRDEDPEHVRRVWHPECVEEHRLEKDQGFFRIEVWKRDKGKCLLCGLDTEKLAEIIRSIHSRSGGEHPFIHGLIVWGFDRHAIQEMTLWEADHIVPRAEGGSALGLENGRTLCIPCHKSETAKLAVRLAEKKRQDRDKGLVARRAE